MREGERERGREGEGGREGGSGIARPQHPVVAVAAMPRPGCHGPAVTAVTAGDGIAAACSGGAERDRHPLTPLCPSIRRPMLPSSIHARAHARKCAHTHTHTHTHTHMHTHVHEHTHTHTHTCTHTHARTHTQPSSRPSVRRRGSLRHHEE